MSLVIFINYITINDYYFLIINYLKKYIFYRFYILYGARIVINYLLLLENNYRIIQQTTVLCLGGIIQNRILCYIRIIKLKLIVLLCPNIKILYFKVH